MKKLNWLLVGAVLMSIPSCGNKNKSVEVPEKIKLSLLKHFPDATEIKWEKETAYEWEADFKMYENKYSANFDPEGNMLVMEYDMNVKDLPLPIVQNIDSTFTGYKIKKAEYAEKGEIHFFEIELANSEKTLEVVYDETGAMLNNEDRNKEIRSPEED